MTDQLFERRAHLVPAAIATLMLLAVLECLGTSRSWDISGDSIFNSGPK